MSEKYTEEQIISIWREMLSDMKEEFGNDVSYDDKLDFEERWVKHNHPELSGRGGVLCYYVEEFAKATCKECPVYWGIDEDNLQMGCCDNNFYDEATVNELLRLPGKNVFEEYEELVENQIDFDSMF